MNKVKLPLGDVTVEQAALLLTDARYPNADEKTRYEKFRWMLNGFLANVHAGTLHARFPPTGEPIGPEGISVSDYAHIMVLSPDDVRNLAEVRGIECANASDDEGEKRRDLGSARGITGKPRKRHREDLLAPLISAALRELGDAGAAEVFTLLRTWAKQKKPPLIGVTDTGIQWVDVSDEVREINQQAIGARVRRAKLRR